MVKDTTLYDRLQLPTDASESQIKKAFHQLSKQYHPDKHPEEQKEEASKKFQGIQQAKEILLDDQKRQQYDQIGMDILQQNQNQNHPEGMGGFPFGGGFGGFPFGGMQFGGMPFGGGRPQEQNEPIVYPLEVTLEQVCREEPVTITYPCFYQCNLCHGEGTATGKPNPCGSCGGQGKKMQVMRMGPMIQQSVVECQQCRGKGTVIELSQACSGCLGEGKTSKSKTRTITMKNGLETGHKMNLQGKGHYLKYGGRGDLIIMITVTPHSLFKRYQNDLFTVVSLTMYQGLFGYTITLPHVDGRLIRLKSTTRTEPQTVQCLPYEGMRHLESQEKGKLYILFQMRLPELPVIQECKPLLQSLDPTEVTRENIAAQEIAVDVSPTVHDHTMIHSIYYQLVHQEQAPRSQQQQQQQQQQPNCVHQ